MFLPAAGGIYLVIDSLPIFGAERRCIHDRLAGTIVIKLGTAGDAPTLAESVLK